MSFNNIYGHEKQIGIIRKSLAQGRISHAYLFSGLAAVGKKTLASELAKALNCEKSDQIQDACEACPSCLKANHSNHPDIHLVAAEGQFIRINAIREIQEQMKFKPLEGKRRVIIINDAEKMNDQAANALLKTLEEPSESNILILVSARPYVLPATIISRCRQMRFDPLSNATVARFLVERLAMEKQKAQLLSLLSGGSPGRAIELNKENAEDYREEIFQALAMVNKKDPLSLVIFASFLAQDKKEIRQGLDVLNSCFRDALVFKETAKKEMLINQDKSRFIADLAQRLSGNQILQNIAFVERSREAIEQNVNKSLTLETMAFKLHI